MEKIHLFFCPASKNPVSVRIDRKGEWRGIIGAIRIWLRAKERLGRMWAFAIVRRKLFRVLPSKLGNIAFLRGIRITKSLRGNYSRPSRKGKQRFTMAMSPTSRVKWAKNHRCPLVRNCQLNSWLSMTTISPIGASSTPGRPKSNSNVG